MNLPTKSPSTAPWKAGGRWNDPALQKLRRAPSGLFYCISGVYSISIPAFSICASNKNLCLDPFLTNWGFPIIGFSVGEKNFARRKNSIAVIVFLWYNKKNLQIFCAAYQKENRYV
ncbi:MAG: hypothetical protein IJC15_03460, partial [Clostridia bacterium]|nr:hypothetical protein [Clostridia bacterium]